METGDYIGFEVKLLWWYIEIVWGGKAGRYFKGGHSGANPIFGMEGIFLEVLYRELWNEHQKFKRSWRPGEGARASVRLLWFIISNPNWKRTIYYYYFKKNHKKVTLAHRRKHAFLHLKMWRTPGLLAYDWFDFFLATKGGIPLSETSFTNCPVVRFFFKKLSFPIKGL